MTKIRSVNDNKIAHLVKKLHKAILDILNENDTKSQIEALNALFEDQDPQNIANALNQAEYPLHKMSLELSRKLVNRSYSETEEICRLMILLLDNGADPNLYDGINPTPIRLVLIESQIENLPSDYTFRCGDLLKKMIEKRVDLDFISYSGKNFAHAAAFLDASVVKVILDAKPEQINIKDKKGDTPLNIAIKVNRTSAIKELLNQGASLSELNNDLVTPLELSIKKGNLWLINEFLKRDVNICPFTSAETIEENVLSNRALMNAQIMTLAQAGYYLYLNGKRSFQNQLESVFQVKIEPDDRFFFVLQDSVTKKHTVIKDLKTFEQINFTVSPEQIKRICTSLRNVVASLQILMAVSLKSKKGPGDILVYQNAKDDLIAISRLMKLARAKGWGGLSGYLELDVADNSHFNAFLSDVSIGSHLDQEAVKVPDVSDYPAYQYLELQSSHLKKITSSSDTKDSLKKILHSDLFKNESAADLMVVCRKQFTMMRDEIKKCNETLWKDSPGVSFTILSSLRFFIAAVRTLVLQGKQNTLTQEDRRFLETALSGYVNAHYLLGEQDDMGMLELFEHTAVLCLSDKSSKSLRLRFLLLHFVYKLGMLSQLKLYKEIDDLLEDLLIKIRGNTLSSFVDDDVSNIQPDFFLRRVQLLLLALSSAPLDIGISARLIDKIDEFILFFHPYVTEIKESTVFRKQLESSYASCLIDLGISGEKPDNDEFEHFALSYQDHIVTIHLNDRVSKKLIHPFFQTIPEIKKREGVYILPVWGLSIHKIKDLIQIIQMFDYTQVLKTKHTPPEVIVPELQPSLPVSKSIVAEPEPEPAARVSNKKRIEHTQLRPAAPNPINQEAQGHQKIQEQIAKEMKVPVEDVQVLSGIWLPASQNRLWVVWDKIEGEITEKNLAFHKKLALDGRLVHKGLGQSGLKFMYEDKNRREAGFRLKTKKLGDGGDVRVVANPHTVVLNQGETRVTVYKFGQVTKHG